MRIAFHLFLYFLTIAPVVLLGRELLGPAGDVLRLEGPVVLEQLVVHRPEFALLIGGESRDRCGLCVFVER